MYNYIFTCRLNAIIPAHETVQWEPEEAIVVSQELHWIVSLRHSENNPLYWVLGHTCTNNLLKQH